MKAKTRHWFIYQQPCFRFHIFAIHLIGVRIMPLAGRDVKAIVILRRTEDISIHAPLAGRDVAYIRSFELPPDISIHAPLAGRDALARA